MTARLRTLQLTADRFALVLDRISEADTESLATTPHLEKVGGTILVFALDVDIPEVDQPLELDRIHAGLTAATAADADPSAAALAPSWRDQFDVYDPAQSRPAGTTIPRSMVQGHPGIRP